MRTPKSLSRAAASALVVLLFVVGCGGGERGAVSAPAPPPAPSSAEATPAPPEPTPDASPSDAPADEEQSADFRGTIGKTEREGRGAPALLRAVRTANRGGYERVVFEFAGRRLPGYSVEYVDRPVRQCGSGEAVPVAGDAWLRVRLTPANAHTDAGEATVRDRDRRLNYPNLKELKILCDFEAEVEWVMGLAKPTRYRVLELRNPARLVIDVKKK